MQTIRLAIKPYLAEYLIKTYPSGEPGIVKVPPTLNLYEVILSNMHGLKKEKADMDRWNVEIMLPNPSQSSSRRLTCKRYGVSGQGSIRISRSIYALYWSDCHSYLEHRINVHGDTIIDAIYGFLDSRGLTLSTEEAIRRNYQRWRMRRKSHAKDRNF